MILEWQRRWEREKHWFVVSLIYAFIGWFLYMPWPGIEPTTLEYQDDAPTNWATQPGSELSFSVGFSDVKDTPKAVILNWKLQNKTVSRIQSIEELNDVVANPSHPERKERENVGCIHCVSFGGVMHENDCGSSFYLCLLLWLLVCPFLWVCLRCENSVDWIVNACDERTALSN